MKVPLIVYRNQKEEKRNDWIKLFLRRIKQNKNNLVSIVGQTGSGKTWSAMSICETIAKENDVPFCIDNIIFTLKELMQLINSGKLKEGSCIIFDEPQVTISAREFMSKANRVFNYLVSTFRHKNLSLFFCTPYEDLLDKSTRKLFHARLETLSINTKEKIVTLKPSLQYYNSTNGKFLYPYLRRAWKPEDSTNYIVRPLKEWEVTKPSSKLIKLYEAKKLDFTTKLNQQIEKELDEYDKKVKPKVDLKLEATALLERLGSMKLVAKALNISKRAVYYRLQEEGDTS